MQLPLALLTGLLAQYFGQRHKVQHISEAISVYVPEDISRALISQDLMPEDLNRVSFSTCLATDMEGFTSISERMEPGKLAEFLNDYFDTLARPMQALRIGMETGEVYIGHSGGGGNLGYRVVGDCANSASRIEGLNKYLGTRILATESVIAGLDGLLARSVGQFVFVGKSNPLSIIEIVNLATEATPRQSELCERFTRAIEYFMNEDWKTAARQFESILETIGEDGPARFYLSQCLQRIEIAPRSDDPAVIHLNAK
jgi:adenylate cyclase